jgi:soluble lytic murein transglycosylase-like protein
MHTHNGSPQLRPTDAVPRRRLSLRLIAALTLALTLAGPSVAQAETPALDTQAYKAHAQGRLGGNGTQFHCLDRLWQRESGWNPNAQNRRSTAYGIPQLLDGTWAMTGIRKTSNPYRQVDAGLVYIRKRHGTACGAWNFHQAHNWY